MRIFGWIVGGMLFAVGVLSLVLAVDFVYTLENESSELYFLCTTDAGTAGIGLADCRGDAGLSSQLDDMGWIALLGFVGVGGVISGAVLIGAGMVAGARAAVGPPAGGWRPVPPYAGGPAGPPQSGPPPSGPPPSGQQGPPAPGQAHPNPQGAPPR